QHAARRLVRTLIWWFHADLKAYRRAPERRRRHELRARLDRIFRRRTGFATLDRPLARPHANEEELPVALDRPAVPLPTTRPEPSGPEPQPAPDPVPPSRPDRDLPLLLGPMRAYAAYDRAALARFCATLSPGERLRARAILAVLEGKAREQGVRARALAAA